MMSEPEPPATTAEAPETGRTFDDTIPLLPARMVNEYVYCPRLAYLMWAQSEWDETGDTVEGKAVHARADRPSAPLPDPAQVEALQREVVSRAVTLSSQELGVIAKIDIAESADGCVTPIDYKRGRRPHVAMGAYEPERVQVCLQGMLLEEHGYQVDGGALYFAESRERVAIAFDEGLRASTRAAVEGLRGVVREGQIPPPLIDSPKCPRCALVSICLPDEVSALQGAQVEMRPIAVPTTSGLPLIVQSQRARISKEGETLKITDDDAGETTVRLIDVSDVALFGNAYMTTPALTTLMEREIPVTYHSFGGWFRGMTQGIGHRNVEVRTAQYRASFDDAARLRFARSLVAAKIVNQRTIVRRNWHGDEDARDLALLQLRESRRAATRARSHAELLGIEGDAAATYFRAFSRLLAPPGGDMVAFRFDNRNRRPPTDPVNAMLSLAYAMLTRQLTIALATVGLDPYRGLYHAERFGRPSLALDVMEPFRPVIADSVVLSAINTGIVRPEDFISAATGTALSPTGRRRFVEAFERRLTSETTHPVFGYRLSMRRLLLVQARLLCRYFVGEIPEYPHYLPR